MGFSSGLCWLEVVKPAGRGWREGVEEARETICKPKGQAFPRDAAGGCERGAGGRKAGFREMKVPWVVWELSEGQWDPTA